jgi:hypothetical protein
MIRNCNSVITWFITYVPGSFLVNNWNADCRIRLRDIDQDGDGGGNVFYNDLLVGFARFDIPAEEDQISLLSQQFTTSPVDQFLSLTSYRFSVLPAFGLPFSGSP